MEILPNKVSNNVKTNKNIEKCYLCILYRKNLLNAV